VRRRDTRREERFDTGIFAVMVNQVRNVESYLIEQEDKRFSSLEIVQRCMDAWKPISGA
jgi:hypothetical protein